MKRKKVSGEEKFEETCGNDTGRHRIREKLLKVKMENMKSTLHLGKGRGI